MEFRLQNVLKALLFSTAEPVSTKDIQGVISRYHAQVERDDRDPEGENEGEQEVLEDLLDQVPSLLTNTQIRDAMDAIRAELEEAGSVFRLQEVASGYRFVIAPEYAEWVRLLRDEPRPRRLSPAATETLAIVAYRQPVTRAEVEAIRGVSSDNAISRLLERELIQVVGRAELPGRPIQYGTGEAFLEYVGIRSLEELPASDVLSPNEISEFIHRSSQAPEEIDETTVGLPTGD